MNAPLTWTGPHGLSLGGSYRGSHVPSLTGYWIHDHVAGRARYKIYRMGVGKQLACRATLAAAQDYCRENIIAGANAVLSDAKVAK